MTHLTGKSAHAIRRGPVLAMAAVAAAGALGACGSSSSSNASAASGSGAAGSSSSGKYTLNVGFIGTEGQMTGPEGFAYATGQLQKWLGADGITVKTDQFANGPLLTAAMTGGSVDLGIVGDTPALLAYSSGVPIEAINQNELNLPAWIIAKKGGATTLAGLSGQTVARPQGSFIDRYLQGKLSDEGLTSKVQLIAMLPPQAIAAAQSGSVAAVALPAWETAPVIAAGGVVVAKSETTPDIEGTEITVATKKVLAAHPSVAADWNAARKKAVAYANAHVAQFYAFEAKANGIKGGASAAKQFLPVSNFPVADYTTTGQKTLQGTLNFLVGEKEAKAFTLTSWRATGT